MTFKQLGVSEPILQALVEHNYETPTPIQQKAIPVVLNGDDMFGLAQTGTGKTAAFAIPIIEHLSKEVFSKKNKKIRALVLTPTRELAIQIQESFALYSKYTNVKHAVIFGGVKPSAQQQKLSRGVDVLIATPGRLIDFINQGIVKLSDISHFVLDEADRMLDMGFIHDIKRILPLLPSERQTLLFSATMPVEIVKISKNILVNPKRVEIAPESSIVDTISQKIFFVEKLQKIKLLTDIISEHNDKTILIFSRTKHGADKLARVLSKQNIKSEAIHGNKSQNSRQNTLTNFKNGTLKIVIATDIAARGIDISNLGLVVNYDMPETSETYVHRIGRTGRAGRDGLAYSFCTNEQRDMLKVIQKLTNNKIKTTLISVK